MPSVAPGTAPPHRPVLPPWGKIGSARGGAQPHDRGDFFGRRGAHDQPRRAVIVAALLGEIGRHVGGIVDDASRPDAALMRSSVSAMRGAAVAHGMDPRSLPLHLTRSAAARKPVPARCRTAQPVVDGAAQAVLGDRHDGDRRESGRSSSRSAAKRCAAASTRSPLGLKDSVRAAPAGGSGAEGEQRLARPHRDCASRRSGRLGA